MFSCAFSNLNLTFNFILVSKCLFYLGSSGFSSSQGHSNPFLVTTTLPPAVTFSDSQDFEIVNNNFDTSQTLYLGDIKRPLTGKEVNDIEIANANQVPVYQAAQHIWALPPSPPPLSASRNL